MTYNAPVLVEVGTAGTVVLGLFPNGTDNQITFQTLPVDLALGLDD